MKRFIRISLIGFLILMYLDAKYPEWVWYKTIIIMMASQLLYMLLLETEWGR